MVLLSSVYSENSHCIFQGQSCSHLYSKSTGNLMIPYSGCRQSSLVPSIDDFSVSSSPRLVKWQSTATIANIIPLP
jgi:hypothetical protein